MVPLFGAAYASRNKGTTILYWFRSPKTVLNPPVNGKIQGLSRSLSVFQEIFKAKLIFKTVLYIQVLLKPVRTLQWKIGLSSLGAAGIFLVQNTNGPWKRANVTFICMQKSRFWWAFWNFEGLFGKNDGPKKPVCPPYSKMNTRFE